jgi:hypothetical protein
MSTLTDIDLNRIREAIRFDTGPAPRIGDILTMPKPVSPIMQARFRDRLGVAPLTRGDGDSRTRTTAAMQDGTLQAALNSSVPHTGNVIPLSTAVNSTPASGAFQMPNGDAEAPADSQSETESQAQTEPSWPNGVPYSDDELERPEINTSSRDLPDITTEAINALAAHNFPRVLFVRARALVRVVKDDKGHPVIEVLTEDRLRYELAEAAYFTRKIRVKEDWYVVPTPPPAPVVKNINAVRDFERKFLPLSAIVETPILRPDGTILIRRGYDVKTGLYYQPTDGLVIPPIPEFTTDADIMAAVAVIEDVIGEFPFVTPAAKANAVGFMLTPIVRAALGPMAVAPLALIDAAAPGTGKGLFMDICAIIATGRTAAPMSPNRSPEEWRKTLFAALRGGRTFLVIDNLEDTLGGESLSQTLTADMVRDRVLGVSEEVAVPNLATWAATGNNITVTGDLIRRTYRVRMDAKVARPGLRSGPDEKHTWKHPMLKEYVIANRGAILAALLTLARAWYVAGQPIVKVRSFGSFQAWATGIGGILDHAGYTEFLDNLEQDYDDTDAETVEWEVFLRTWIEVLGSGFVDMTAIMERLTPTSSSQRAYADGDWGEATHRRVEERAAHDAALREEFERREAEHTRAVKLRNALPAELADAMQFQQRNFRITLGKALRKRQDTRFGSEGFHIEIKPDTHDKTNRYRVAAAFQLDPWDAPDGNGPLQDAESQVIGKPKGSSSNTADSAGSAGSCGESPSQSLTQQLSSHASTRAHAKRARVAGKAPTLPASPRTPRKPTPLVSTESRQ